MVFTRQVGSNEGAGRAEGRVRKAGAVACMGGRHGVRARRNTVQFHGLDSLQKA